MPIHLRANKSDYASTVLLVGDPGRAENISKVLKNSKLVNKNRGLLGYTGTYKDKQISVQTTGMGCPSTAIVVEELIQLDVKRLIRIGTCGGIGKDIKPLDIIGAVAASPFDGTTRTYLNNEPHAPFATFEILKTAYDVSKTMGINVYFSSIASVDVFYNPFSDYVEKLRAKGIIAVEMETSLIYYLANRSNKQAATFLLVSDIVGGGEEFTKYVTDQDLAKGMDQLINYVLEVFYHL
ncbi:MAG: purine-nucleoside phosphorylase [Candidatus Stahlbacteria bacterium]|nr:purine-nucleoside phosphorylase [candidate division WOR-3 bacterium]MCK4673773.1 purine-nucleoside phosphorylase [candidate division WOR-3 bacterium]TET60259.1 MAG: purine-nucleoside phosphorylase [Candidatus Stahlbacteria bacterium]